MTLKDILLEKLNRILNPNFEAKFIRTLLVSGIALIGYQRVVQFASSIEIISRDIYIKLSLSSGVDFLFVIIGCLMICASCYLFSIRSNKNNESKTNYRSLKKAAPALRKCLEENERVFKECGPNSSQYQQQEELRVDFTVWDNAKVNIILPNNDKIYKIISSIKKYSPEENRIINRMKTHIEHFEVHVKNDEVDYTDYQFPQEFSDLIYSYKKISRKHQMKINEMTEWLVNELVDIDVEKAYFFGSFLYSEYYHDIDLLIKTTANTRESIRASGQALKSFKAKCKTEKGEDLHLSIFSEIESDDFMAFKNKIRNLEEVI